MLEDTDGILSLWHFLSDVLDAKIVYESIRRNSSVTLKNFRHISSSDVEHMPRQPY
jgi:hypothetical protein